MLAVMGSDVVMVTHEGVDVALLAVFFPSCLHDAVLCVKCGQV
jgi:hypothetical protein